MFTSAISISGEKKPCCNFISLLPAGKKIKRQTSSHDLAHMMNGAPCEKKNNLKSKKV